MTPKDYLEIVHIINQLKDTPRHCVTKNNRIESVAEHSWRIAMMALLLEDTFSDVDIDKVMRMCIIHDLGECFTGDIPVFLKTDDDRRQEAKLLDEFLDTLPEQLSHNMLLYIKKWNHAKAGKPKSLKHSISSRLSSSIMKHQSAHGKSMSMICKDIMHLMLWLFLPG